VIPDPLVGCCSLPADLLGGVGRRVVGDDQFEVPVRLGKDGVDRLLEVAFAVVDGQADGDTRTPVLGHAVHPAFVATRA